MLKAEELHYRSIRNLICVNQVILEAGPPLVGFVAPDASEAAAGLSAFQPTAGSYLSLGELELDKLDEPTTQMTPVPTCILSLLSK